MIEEMSLFGPLAGTTNATITAECLPLLLSSKDSILWLVLQPPKQLMNRGIIKDRTPGWGFWIRYAVAVMYALLPSSRLSAFICPAFASIPALLASFASINTGFAVCSSAICCCVFSRNSI